MLTEKSLDSLSQVLGYCFQEPALLQQALTHNSYCNESRENDDKTFSYERLEFLGDAILGFLISEKLFKLLPAAHEGELSAKRDFLINEGYLASLARRLGLGKYIYLGRGELRQGGKRKDSILADVFEAVLAAIYLDGGLPAAYRFVEMVYGDLVGLEDNKIDDLRYKNLLQEETMRRWQLLPEYCLRGVEGPEHQKIFLVEVYLGERCLGRGRGASKKKAEMAAAREALKNLPVFIDHASQ